MNVHPLAAMFPMLPDDELDALATSIKEHGQRHPILIADMQVDGGELIEVIVDGRNRFEACRRAKVEPKFERLNGVDIAALILAENVERRNLSAGQRAMARAMLTRDVKQGSRTDLAEEDLGQLADVAERSVRRARFVLRQDEALAQSVMNGVESLNAAYETAKASATAKDRAAEAEKARREQLDTLRQRYPDLARKVEDGEIGVAAALVEAREKDTQARSQRDTIFRAFKSAVEGLAILAFETESVAALAKEHRSEFEQIFPLGSGRLKECASHAQKGTAKLLEIIDTMRKDRLL
jgi:ParB-like chromosome segregation protein Spo0J